MKNLLLTIPLIAVLLASCEGGTELVKKIDNRTDITITIVFYNTLYDTADTLVVEGNATEKAYTGGGERRFFPDYTCLWEMDSIKAFPEGGHVLNTDINDETLWVLHTSGNNYKYHECTFTILPEDLR